jgi:hypothetical protein
MPVCSACFNTEQHLGLVDELSTAAEYIDACKERADVYRVSRYLDTSTMLFGTYDTTQLHNKSTCVIIYSEVRTQTSAVCRLLLCYINAVMLLVCTCIHAYSHNAAQLHC